MKYQDLKLLLAEEDIDKTIKVLSSQKKELKIDVLKKEWNVNEHAVSDPTLRQDKQVTATDEQGNDYKKTEPVNRISVPFQKSIVGKAVSFLFGNSVDITSSAVSEQETSVVTAVKNILDSVKSDTQNRVVAKELFRSTQVAEIWYPTTVDEQHEEYGFKTKFKLRMSVFSPWDGNELLPFFDDFGDMIAFSRGFKVKDENQKDVEHFETYTSEVYIKWRKVGSIWGMVDKPIANPIKRIPVIYAEQEGSEWADVQKAIERLEILFSNHADTNDYNGSPTLVTKGQLLTLGAKGERGKVLEVERDGSVEYLSWDHAPESIRLEIENLLKIILTYTQTPDISFESVKGLGAISGIALKLLFMDAHLKVMQKREVFDPYLERRINVIKSFIGEMDKTLSAVVKAVKVKATIIPYMIHDDIEQVNLLVAANGGKAIISQRTSVAQSGMVDDAKEEYKQLQAEYDRENTMTIGEPTF